MKYLFEEKGAALLFKVKNVTTRVGRVQGSGGRNGNVSAHRRFFLNPGT
jgi:hypothetical protein